MRSAILHEMLLMIMGYIITRNVIDDYGIILLHGILLIMTGLYYYTECY